MKVIKYYNRNIKRSYSFLLNVLDHITKVFALHANAVIAKNNFRKDIFKKIIITGHYYRVTIFVELSTPLLILAKLV